MGNNITLDSGNSTNYIIDLSDKLGEGAYAIVYRIKHKETMQRFAAKIYKTEIINMLPI